MPNPQNSNNQLYSSQVVSVMLEEFLDFEIDDKPAIKEPLVVHSIFYRYVMN